MKAGLFNKVRPFYHKPFFVTEAFISVTEAFIPEAGTFILKTEVLIFENKTLVYDFYWDNMFFYLILFIKTSPEIFTF